MLQILYNDGHIVAVVKPAGVLSEDKGEGSMPALLRAELGCAYIGCVHRLDCAVGGVMVYALDQPSCGKLSAMVASHQMVKEYLAVVHGCPESSEGKCGTCCLKTLPATSLLSSSGCGKVSGKRYCITSCWRHSSGRTGLFRWYRFDWRLGAAIRSGCSFLPGRCRWLVTGGTGAGRMRTA